MKKFRQALKFGPVAGLAGVGTSAMAAVPEIVGTSLATVQTDSLAAIDLVWPVVMAVLGGFIILKIVKRAAGKI